MGGAITISNWEENRSCMAALAYTGQKSVHVRASVLLYCFICTSQSPFPHEMYNTNVRYTICVSIHGFRHHWQA